MNGNRNKKIQMPQSLLDKVNQLAMVNKVNKLHKEGGLAVMQVTMEAMTALFWPGAKCFNITGLPADTVISGMYFNARDNMFYIHIRSLNIPLKNAGEAPDLYMGGFDVVRLEQADYDLIASLKKAEPDNMEKSLSEILDKQVEKAAKKMGIHVDETDGNSAGLTLEDIEKESKEKEAVRRYGDDEGRRED